MGKEKLEDHKIDEGKLENVAGGIKFHVDNTTFP